MHTSSIHNTYTHTLSLTRPTEPQCNINAEVLLVEADAMVSSGMVAAGYRSLVSLCESTRVIEIFCSVLVVVQYCSSSLSFHTLRIDPSATDPRPLLAHISPVPVSTAATEH